jgi:hypothetical protein
MKEDKMGRVCNTNGEKTNTYRILVPKPEGKRLLRKTRHRWVDNIKMVLREIEWRFMDWFHVSQDRNQWRDLVNKVMNFGSTKC